MSTFRRLATKPFVILPTVAVVGLAGWVVIRPGNESGGTTEDTDQVVEATLGPMSQAVSAEGTIQYEETENLNFTAAGTVTAVNVKAGDEVKAGDVLAELDSPELEADVAQAETAVAEAEARLADDKAAGASDAQIAADESSLATANDQLEAAGEALAGNQLIASFDGTIASVGITAGEDLGSGGTSGTDQTGNDTGSGQSSSLLGDATSQDGAGSGDTGSEAHVQVVSGSRFIIELGFDDSDIENVEAGAEASISLSSSSGSEFGGGEFPGAVIVEGGPGGARPQFDFSDTAGDDAATSVIGDVEAASGEVTDVSDVADASSGVARYPVTVKFTDDSGDFNAGANVVVDISYGSPEEVVQVPAFAVNTEDESSTVTVRTDDGDETRDVVTGRRVGAMVEIVSGLEAGEKAVVSVPVARGGTSGD